MTKNSDGRDVRLAQDVPLPQQVQSPQSPPSTQVTITQSTVQPDPTPSWYFDVAEKGIFRPPPPGVPFTKRG
jgi:hypothetical protein